MQASLCNVIIHTPPRSLYSTSLERPHTHKHTRSKTVKNNTKEGTPQGEEKESLVNNKVAGSEVHA
jgi:hypothetical protein